MPPSASRFVKPVLALSTLGATSYVAYKYYNQPAPPQTFEITIRQRLADGTVGRVPVSIPMIPAHEVDLRLRRNEAVGPRLPSGWRIATAFVPANDPIEDAHAHAVVTPNDKVAAGAPGETIMAAVFDGHAGYHTSRLLAKTLLPGIALEMQTLKEAFPNTKTSTPSGVVSYLKSLVTSPPVEPTTTTDQKTFDADPKYVSMALKTSFARLDSEIINAPFHMLTPLFKADPTLRLDPEQHPMALPRLLPAMSGSCALVAVIDTTHKLLHVALTGDCRAVAGLAASPPQDRTDVHWTIDVLTEDQTGRNISELKRIQSEHPADEADFVIQRGRILGGLEPSRAFGDARYKWPRAFQERLAKAMDGYRRPPTDLKSPPYVTSEPETSYRSFADGKMQFIVLATDGLWDELSNAEVVALTGAHLSGERGPVQKVQLAQTVAQGTSSGVDGKQKARAGDKGYSSGEQWTFVDENPATHLIRNAIGKGDALKLRRNLSIPAPHARRFRDDMTVTVIWLDTTSSSGDVHPLLKAKL